MQSVSSKIWTRVAVSISYDDNHYTTDTSQAWWNLSKLLMWRWLLDQVPKEYKTTDKTHDSLTTNLILMAMLLPDHTAFTLSLLTFSILGCILESRDPFLERLPPKYRNIQPHVWFDKGLPRGLEWTWPSSFSPWWWLSPEVVHREEMAYFFFGIMSIEQFLNKVSKSLWRGVEVRKI